MLMLPLSAWRRSRRVGDVAGFRFWGLGFGVWGLGRVLSAVTDRHLQTVNSRGSRGSTGGAFWTSGCHNVKHSAPVPCWLNKMPEVTPPMHEPWNP